MSADGIVVRLGRGLYQLVDAPIEADHTLAEAAKRVPRAVVCLVSALAFHGLTDQHPRRVWLAIGHKDWAPKLDTPAIRVVRFSDKLLSSDVDRATVEGVDVKVFSPVRTIVDLFRHERLVGLPLAIEGLKALLRTRGATASAVAEKAQAIGVWTKVRPYLETLASDA
jgi:predicted transcriptional regulator of viral defense system